MNIRLLPKIELHRHLEGSLRLDTLLAISAEYDLSDPAHTLESLRPQVQLMPDEPRTWQAFLSKFLVLRQFYRSPDIIQRVTREVIADAADDNIRYMELRFTPQALNNLIQADFRDVIGWVCQSAQEESARHNIHTTLIVSMNRHESIEIGDAVLNAAIEYRDYGVVGIDLAGREAEFSGESFIPLFAKARDAGFGITVHAGEWAGADSVRTAIERLHADRIGHGIRAIEDPALIDLLVARETVLEVCPSSNVDSGVVSGLDVHPLVPLYQRGVRTTINTDDPLVSAITLSDEIVRLIEQTPLAMSDICSNMLTAAEAAFLPPDQRAPTKTCDVVIWREVI
jgi:adenosine deaminase